MAIGLLRIIITGTRSEEDQKMGFNIDADSRNADWTKRTWDLLHIDTKEKLLRHLESSGMTVEQFKKLPVYKFNKDKLDFLKDL